MRKLILFGLVCISVLQLWANTTIKLQSTGYKIQFDKDSARVNDAVKLTIFLYWNKADGELKITDFRLPVRPWYKFEGGGSSTGSIGTDSSYFKLEFNLNFNQSGRFVINPVEVFYSYDSLSFGKLTASSPEIIVLNPPHSTVINFLKLNRILLLLVVFFVIVIVWSYFKMRNAKVEVELSTNESNLEFWNTLQSEMNNVFSDKKINYRGSLGELQIIFEKIREVMPPDNKLQHIGELLEQEEKKNFVSFNAFETVYYAIMQIIDEHIKKELNGGVYGNGYSEN